MRSTRSRLTKPAHRIHLGDFPRKVAWKVCIANLLMMIILFTVSQIIQIMLITANRSDANFVRSAKCGFHF